MRPILLSLLMAATAQARNGWPDESTVNFNYQSTQTTLLMENGTTDFDIWFPEDQLNPDFSFSANRLVGEKHFEFTYGLNEYEGETMGNLSIEMIYIHKPYGPYPQTILRGVFEDRMWDASDTIFWTSNLVPIPQYVTRVVPEPTTMMLMTAMVGFILLRRPRR